MEFIGKLQINVLKYWIYYIIMQDSNLHSRINCLLDTQKVKKTVLAKNIKQGESTMHNYLNGTTLPTSDFLEAVVNLTGANGHWILTGKGDMLLSDNTLQEPKILFGNVNHGVAGQMTHTYNNIGDCEKDLAVLQAENALLKKSIQDKELIISLLTNK